MKARLSFACSLFVVLLTPWNAFAQEEEETKRHTIRVQVMLLESSGKLDRELRDGLSGQSGAVMKAIRDLQTEGKAQLANQAELTGMLRIRFSREQRSGSR